MTDDLNNLKILIAQMETKFETLTSAVRSVGAKLDETRTHVENKIESCNSSIHTHIKQDIASKLELLKMEKEIQEEVDIKLRELERRFDRMLASILNSIKTWAAIAIVSVSGSFGVFQYIGGTQQEELESLKMQKLEQLERSINRLSDNDYKANR